MGGVDVLAIRGSSLVPVFDESSSSRKQSQLSSIVCQIFENQRASQKEYRVVWHCLDRSVQKHLRDSVVVRLIDDERRDFEVALDVQV